MQVGGARSVRVPALEKTSNTSSLNAAESADSRASRSASPTAHSKPSAPNAGAAGAAEDTINVLQVYGETIGHLRVASSKINKLVGSDNRHGDLQVALSALRNAELCVRTLIAIEE